MKRKRKKKMGVYDNYILEIRQDGFSEKDSTKKCINYPNQYFDSYNACDKAFVRRMLNTHYWPELVPFWATKDLSEVTSSYFVDWNYDYVVLYDGSKISDCPEPCTTTSVHSRLIGSFQVCYRISLKIFVLFL